MKNFKSFLKALRTRISNFLEGIRDSEIFIFIKDFLEILGTGALVILGWIYEAIVLSLLWEWFLAPIFGLREISIAEAMGLLVVISLVLKNKASNERGDASTVTYVFVYSFMIPGIFLLLGGLLHWIIPYLP